jgi:CelD/BcsL family acetyltransferase involved in cellulose biosynthesis
VHATLYTSPEALSTLAPAWSALVRESFHNTIFATPVWAQTWWRWFGEGKRLLLITIEDGDRLVGVAPLYLETVDDERLVRFIGGLDVTDYMDIVVRRSHEAVAWDAVLEALRAVAWDALDLHAVRAASPTVAYFRQLGARMTREDVCPCIDPLPVTWDDYLAMLDKKDRHELRRKMRRLSGADVLWWTVCAEDTQAMTSFLTLHRLSSPDKASFMDERMEGYFRDLASQCATHGWLRLCFLSISKKKVASLMAFDYGNQILLYNSGYDPAYTSLSVGLVSVAMAIRDAIAAQRRAFDFLRGDERYKYDLGGRDTEVLAIRYEREQSS